MARTIAAAEAAERTEREQREREELLRDAEAEERAGAEVQWSRVIAVAEAGAVGQPNYLAEAYVPPTPNLFVPSGFAAYVPQRTEYDDDIVLRDPGAQIANTWFEIPVVDTQGNPAEVHLVPARVEPPSVTVPAQARETSRSERTRLPPQKKIAARTPTSPVTTRRQTRISQPAPAHEEAARKVVARAELQYQIKMRERPS
ncbi:hypothetical protein RHMOL_Rhmol08G0177500 [Rhododendron molle]|uniref:Uncharacterized protein n=1 Tax=Rhododendron molle TaxID=49168 RepID=A0ACC0MRI8_RHOML|nr:hypothetical protein RHMOL_Rhmol08G0177500 [Rhododendron molle]